MSSRMEKYKKEEEIPTRSSKNKELYKQVYNAYDNFENLTVPSNAREIDLSNLKKEVTSRDEYREMKIYGDITNNKVVRKEKVQKEQKKENEIYDINELLNKALSENKKPELIETNMATGDYLKKLKLDNSKTNIEQVKEMYENIKEESMDDGEDEALLKTANLSLEILSDLKGDNDITKVSAPIKEEELSDNDLESDFYSSTYKFSKKDFEDKKYESNIKLEEKDTQDDEDFEEDDGTGKFFFKVLLLIFGILLIVVILIYLFNYFNRV